MSISMSGHSNCSSSPVSRRHSVTSKCRKFLNSQIGPKSRFELFFHFYFCLSASQPGQVEELNMFKNRKTSIRRSARSGNVRGPIDPKGMLKPLGKFFLF